MIRDKIITSQSEKDKAIAEIRAMMKEALCPEGVIDEQWDRITKGQIIFDKLAAQLLAGRILGLSAKEQQENLKNKLAPYKNVLTMMFNSENS